MHFESEKTVFFGREENNTRRIVLVASLLQPVTKKTIFKYHDRNKRKLYLFVNYQLLIKSAF